MDISLREIDKFMGIEFSSNTVKDHQLYELSTLQNISHIVISQVLAFSKKLAAFSLCHCE